MKRKKLSIAMIQAGISGNQLSEKTGIARSRVSWIINGHWNPSLKEMHTISRVLGRNYNEIFGKEVLSDA